jgi:hypothetical protein
MLLALERNRLRQRGDAVGTNGASCRARGGNVIDVLRRGPNLCLGVGQTRSAVRPWSAVDRVA